LNFVDFIESEKVGLYHQLDHLFSDSKLDQVEQATHIIDRLIAEYCCDALLRNAPTIFGADFSRVGKQLVTIGSVDYALQFSELDTRDEGNLPFLLSARTTDTLPKGVQHLTIKLSVNGRYRTATFTCPKVVDPKTDLISELISSLFRVGYYWLDDKIVQAIRASCQATNRYLYRYIEAMLPEPSLLDGFWFSAAADEKDFVILDDFATLRSIHLANANAKRFGRSAANIVAEVVAEIVPINDSVIRDVANGDKSIDLDLSLDPYYSEKQSFRQALHALWGKRVTCYPILSEGKYLVVAFFPTSKKERLEPFLTHHRGRLREIAQQHSDSLIKNLRILSAFRSASTIGSAAEIAGRFVGGLLHSQH
jgi:hypothetical protein